MFKVRLLITLVIITFIMGCVSTPRKQPEPVKLEPVIERIPKPPKQKAIKDLDTSSLVGRKIVIDPGHGGIYPGMIGGNGFKEADANLAVGLTLWGLLKDAGADVYMTRASDKSFIKRADEGVRKDLRQRILINNRINPDLFISIHHNSSTDPAAQNRTEIYYKVDGDGPSKDIAEYIAGSFSGFMSDYKARALPGNFMVLREAASPAVLGEAAFLSISDIELKLSTYLFLKYEAETYFLAIVGYFNRGIPIITDVGPFGDLNDGTVHAIRARVSDSRGAKIDIKSISVNIDGTDRDVRFDQKTGTLISPLPSNLSSGTHKYTIKVRNINGNRSPVITRLFTVNRAPSLMTIAATPPVIEIKGIKYSRIAVNFADKSGNPIKEGYETIFTISGGEMLHQAVLVKNGTAVNYARPDNYDEPFDVTASYGRARKSVHIMPIDDTPQQKTTLIFRITDAGSNPLNGAELREKDMKTPHYSDSEGIIYLQPKHGIRRYSINLSGYSTIDRDVQIKAGTVNNIELAMTQTEQRGIILDCDSRCPIQGEIIEGLRPILRDSGINVLTMTQTDVRADAYINIGCVCSVSNPDCEDDAGISYSNNDEKAL